MVQENKYFNDLYPIVDYKSQEIKSQGVKKTLNNKKGIYLAKQFGRLTFQTGSEIWTLEVPPYFFEEAKKLFGK